MILPFKKQFVQPIMDGTKIHTIREDRYRRWKPGVKIHFSKNTRTKDMEIFKEGVCTNVSTIRLMPNEKYLVIYRGNDICIYTEDFNKENLLLFARNDGFDSLESFWDFFKDSEPILRLIQWTNYQYK